MISFWLYNLLSLTTACFEVPLFLWLCKCQKTWGKQFMRSQNFHDCGAPWHLWHLGFFKNHLKLVNLILVHIFRNGTKTPKMTNLYLHEDLFTLWYSLWGKKQKTCSEWPHLAGSCFMKVFFKMITCPRWPLLSGPKSGHHRFDCNAK